MLPLASGAKLTVFVFACPQKEGRDGETEGEIHRVSGICCTLIHYHASQGEGRGSQKKDLHCGLLFTCFFTVNKGTVQLSERSAFGSIYSSAVTETLHISHEIQNNFQAFYKVVK